MEQDWTYDGNWYNWRTQSYSAAPPEELSEATIQKKMRDFHQQLGFKEDVHSSSMLSPLRNKKLSYGTGFANNLTATPPFPHKTQARAPPSVSSQQNVVAPTNSPLPHGWQISYSNSMNGAVFYCSPTGQSFWRHPLTGEVDPRVEHLLTKSSESEGQKSTRSKDTRHSEDDKSPKEEPASQQDKYLVEKLELRAQYESQLRTLQEEWHKQLLEKEALLSSAKEKYNQERLKLIDGLADAREAKLKQYYEARKDVQEEEHEKMEKSRKRAEELNSQVLEKSIEVQKLRTELEYAEKRISELSSQLDETKSKFTAATASPSKFNEECGAEQENQSLKQQVVSLEGQVKQLRTEHKSTEAKQLNPEEILRLEHEIRQKDATISDQEQQISTLKQSIIDTRNNSELAVERQIKQREQQLFSKMDEAVEAEKMRAEAKITEIMAERDHARTMWHKEASEKRAALNELIDLKGNIRVFARVRPILQVERDSGEGTNAIEIPMYDEGRLNLADSKRDRSHAFAFDEVFGPDSSQESIASATVPILMSVLDGYNVCVFAYGQTGSGKTYTMQGTKSDQGLNFRGLRELFTKIEHRKEELGQVNGQVDVTVTILEVYNESIRDLLTRSKSFDKFEIRQTKDGQVYVENLTETPVRNFEEVLDLMDRAETNRSVGAHNLNEHSSRSHLVVTVTVAAQAKNGMHTRGKLNLIDLAGSERLDKTEAIGTRQKEAAYINKSLSALGNVIGALESRNSGKRSSKASHVPFRDSKLTYLLQDSLSGGSKVIMFVNVSPVAWNVPETLCSLSFATRCRQVQLGGAKKQVESASVAELKSEIVDLRRRLQAAGGLP